MAVSTCVPVSEDLLADHRPRQLLHQRSWNSITLLVSQIGLRQLQHHHLLFLLFLTPIKSKLPFSGAPTGINPFFTSSLGLKSRDIGLIAMVDDHIEAYGQASVPGTFRRPLLFCP